MSICKIIFKILYCIVYNFNFNKITNVEILTGTELEVRYSGILNEINPKKKKLMKTPENSCSNVRAPPPGMVRNRGRGGKRNTRLKKSKKTRRRKSKSKNS